MENNAIILTVIFDVESEGYQAFTQMKQRPITDTYTVLQGALVKKGSNTVDVLDTLSSGVDSTDDTMTGTLIGAFIGLLGGPLGVLIGSVTGQLIGGAKDSSDINRNATLLETVGAKLAEGETAMLLLAQEEPAFSLDSAFDAFSVTLLRRDTAWVQDEVDEGIRVQQELAKEAKRKMHEERSAERKQKMEENRARIRAGFAGLKTKKNEDKKEEE